MEAAGTGQERRRVDPELRNAQGQRIAPNTISVADGFEVVSIQDDPLDPFFGTFDVQNRLMISARCAWEASNLHTIQKPFPQDASETFGILGGGVFPPLPFSGGGGGGGYDDSLFLPQYGNPVAVDTTQAALDANKRTLRRLTYAPHIAPSLPPSPDVFASWQALYDAYTAQGDNPCEICFINPLTAPSPLSIPAGTWRFKDGDIFLGLGREAGILPTVVFLDENCLIVNVHTFQNLSILGQTSTNPQLAWDTYPETMGITLDDTEWGNTGSAPMIRWDGDPSLSEVLLLRLLNGSKIQRLAFEVVELLPNPNPPNVIVQMFGYSEVESATFRGEGEISFRVRSQGAVPNLEQPNFVETTPMASPALFRQRAQRRVIITNNPDSPYDNGDIATLEVGETALIAPSVDGGAPITLLLPPASFVPCVAMGAKKVNGDIHTVVAIQALDAGTIDGQPIYLMPLGAYPYVQFFSDGNAWFSANFSNPLLLPDTIQLTGNVGFPDPLALWRLADNGNSGVVQADGTQAAGLYDATATVTLTPWRTAGSRWGGGLLEAGVRYTGANLGNLRLMGAVSAIAYTYPNATPAGAGRIVAMQGTINDTSEPENANWALYLQGSGEGGANPKIAYFHHYHSGGVRQTASVASPWRYDIGRFGFTCGFTRANDGRTVQLYLNGYRIGLPTLLAAPPSGGGNSRLQINCGLDAANVPVSPANTTTSGVAVFNRELTPQEMRAASLSILLA